MKRYAGCAAALLLGAALALIQSAFAMEPPASRPSSATTRASEPALHAGDRVQISIYDLQEPGREWLKKTVIDAGGKVNVLYLNDVEIAGLTPDDAAEKIAKLAVEKHVLLPKEGRHPGPSVKVTRIAGSTLPAK
jgi:protein involved in polysaccharide export with SLBB domain